MNERRLAWGLEPPPGVPAAWGARAIYARYNDGRLDVPLDRQGGFGGDGELMAWINARGMQLLKDNITNWLNTASHDDRRLEPDSEEVTVIREAGYVIHASPKGSHGYLYIGIWRDE